MATGPQTLVAEPAPAPSLPPPPAEPPPEDEPATRAEISQLLEAVNGLTQRFVITPEQQEEMRQRAVREAKSALEVAAEDEIMSFTPGARAWKVTKWAVGILFGGAGLIFGFGIAYQKAIGDNATKTNVEDSMKVHRTEDFVPLRDEVREFKEDMRPVQEGVGTLVDDRNHKRKFDKAKRKLDRYDKQHAEALQEYTADKAAGRHTGPRPKKGEPHIDLEEQVAELEKTL